MKKYVLLLFSLFTLASCGADQATVDKLTAEMCAALEGVDTSDMSSLMDAALGLGEILEKQDEYSSVTQAQMESSMKEKCPDGWKVFEEISAFGE